MSGLLFNKDLEILEKYVYKIFNNSKQHCYFAEIGIHEGKTAKHLIKILKDMNSNFTYYGIDPGVNHPDIVSTNFVFLKEYSHLIAKELPDLDFVFVDGCHCKTCATRDFHIYSNILNCGGYILMHDASLFTQGKDPQIYTFMRDYHDESIAAKGIAVRDVLDNIIKYDRTFNLEEAALSQEFGGVEVYYKI